MGDIPTRARPRKRPASADNGSFSIAGYWLVGDRPVFWLAYIGGMPAWRIGLPKAGAQPVPADGCGG